MRFFRRIAVFFALPVSGALAGSDLVLRDTIPDSFDLGQSKAANIAFTAPDGGPNTYSIDAALGYWWDYVEQSETAFVSGRWGLVAEDHRATGAKSPKDTRRGSVDGWLLISPNSTPSIFPVDVGVAYQDDRIKKLEATQAFLNASLILRKPKGGAATPPVWVHFLWNASYLPFGDGTFGAAAAPSLGLNLESVNTGGTGQIIRGRAAYSASIKGQKDWAKNFSLDLNWIYQRRLQASGSYQTMAHDRVYTKASLNYSISANVAVVLERVDGEDPFAATGQVYKTSVAFKVRFGKGP